MLGFRAEAEGRILAVQLEEQPDPTIARFEFEKHLEKLLSTTPDWPDSTRAVSELRLSFRVKRKGMTSIFGETKTVHLDIVDYPGEWLMDLGLMEKSYAAWSKETLARLDKKVVGGEEAMKARLEKFDAKSNRSEPDREEIARDFQALMRKRKAAGVYDLIPGRFLLPAELEGAPAITFAPLAGNPQGTNFKIFEKRFEAYKRKVIQPFFRDHFAKLDRQVVIIDVMSALQKGTSALSTLEHAMSDILKAFRPGVNSILSLVFGSKIDRIAFVATKADLIHHVHHDKIVAMTQALMKSAERRAKFSGALTEAKAVASLRTTIEDVAQHKGEEMKIVRGTRAEDGKTIGFHFGDLPQDAEAFLISKMDGNFEAPKLSPPNLSNRKLSGLPHIRMDQLVEFLLSDKLS